MPTDSIDSDTPIHFFNRSRCIKQELKVDDWISTFVFKIILFNFLWDSLLNECKISVFVKKVILKWSLAFVNSSNESPLGLLDSSTDWSWNNDAKSPKSVKLLNRDSNSQKLKVKGLSRYLNVYSCSKVFSGSVGNFCHDSTFWTLIIHVLLQS